MIGIGNMLWRIGDILDIDQQIAWSRDAGFDGIGFHASPGISGKWRGIDPASCDSGRRGELRERIATFSFAEIHAPFAIELRRETLWEDVASLTPILQFADDLGVGVVTVHARAVNTWERSPERGGRPVLERLDEYASKRGVLVALEIVDGFDTVIRWGLSNIGLNLDVGHMYLPANRQKLEQTAGIGGLIRRLGKKLFHLHLHDVVGATDHKEIGTGIVEYDQIASALRKIGYRENATLEMNPDRVDPQGIIRSAETVRRYLI